jgi:hypothetical protein
MLSKCLNPSCSATFRYLSDGRVFHLELPASGNNGTSRRREYFWLCEQCCASFTVVIKDGIAELRSRFLEQVVSKKHVDLAEEPEKSLSLLRDPKIVRP